MRIFFMAATAATLMFGDALAQDEKVIDANPCKSVDTSGFTKTFKRGGVYIESAFHVIDIAFVEELGVCFRLPGEDEFTHRKPEKKPEGGSWGGQIVFEPNASILEMNVGSGAFAWLIHEAGSKEELLPFYDSYALLNFNRHYSIGVDMRHYSQNMLELDRQNSVSAMLSAADVALDERSDSPSGSVVRAYEMDMAELYYDGQIDSEIFLIRLDTVFAAN